MKKIFGLIVITLLVSGCSSSDNSDTNKNAYNRDEMLANWADNIIIPSYQNYTAKVILLSDKAAAFTAAPDAVILDELRTAWLDAYVAYQYVAMYDLGKASDMFLKQTANTYPANVTGIHANIALGTYNLNSAAQFSSQGFPAIDYLINGIGNDTETIAYYSNTNAAAFLNAITVQLKNTAQTVTNDWTNGYRDTYVNNNDGSVTSSVNKTANNFIENLEKDVRSGKIGIPAGLFSNGTTFPDKVEAYYKNDVSKILLNASIKAEQDFFNGKALNGNTTGASLKSALDAVKAVRDGQNLSDIINNQFATINTKNNELNNSFSHQIINDNAKMVTAYNTLQQNVIYIKLDMMQALNVTIDYVDGDGD
ncbi:imelysin family protein [Flavobacterium hauense]